MSDVSKLVGDLNSVPGIVSALGLGVAEAQKAFNLDYLESLEKLLVLAQRLYHPKGADGKELSAEDKAKVAELVRSMVTELAPPRYQFTETQLKVRLDLAQTMDTSISAGFGVNLYAVSVNAGLTLGFGYDYQAAAEVTTTLHAVPGDKKVLETLLGRAKEIGDLKLTPPERSTVDDKLSERSHSILGQLLEKEVVSPTKKNG